MYDPDKSARLAAEAAEAIEKVYGWLREPDWAEEWNIYNWATRRPVAEVRAAQALAAALQDANAEVVRLREALRRVIEAAERSQGDHFAPDDCFATGPSTGNPWADLVACPGCVQQNEIEAARALLPKENPNA